ncbi:MAG: triose-phosphate isomerase [Bacteroidota bacterium]
MRKKLVAGNWKMHGSLRGNAALLERIVGGLSGVGCEVLVCVPYPYLAQVADQLRATPVSWGAQNVSEHAAGAFTGEVAASMLAEFGCAFVLVGHSERRTLFGESDAVVAAKCQVVLAAGMCPVLCVGETLAEREAGLTQAVVDRQLSAVLDAVGVANFARMVVAYEPVWAIGTGLTASPAQAEEVHAAIRSRIAGLDPLVAEGLRILYGGSVKPQSAVELFAQPNIDGGLIGGAALVADDFLAICQAAG